jgi:hypothetical protein
MTICKPLLVMLAGMSLPAIAAINLYVDPGETVTRRITINAICSATQECPPPVACPPVKPGKGHGGMHTAYASEQYQACLDCHTPENPDGAIPQSWPGSFCPSQAPEFAPPELLSLLGLPALTMYGQTITLSDGTTFVDEVTGQPIVIGGPLGGYAPGETPLCVHCHQHWQVEPEQLGWKKNLIHYGCLHCHRGVGDSEVRPGIKNLLEK